MDVIIVTYNSEKWVSACIDSLEIAGSYFKELNLYIVDNNSSDTTCNLLEERRVRTSLNGFEILHQKENLGFGLANNIGAKAGQSSIICFINIDTTVYPDTFSVLDCEILKSNEKVAAWEMRQLPYEHPKIYDPVTGETGWVSGAAFAVRREIFEAVGGFDSNLFMYAEDVDLSWRIRALGYSLQYCPKVKINHFSYQNAYEVKPIQYVNSLINNLLLRYRYGGIFDIIRGHLNFWKVALLYKSAYPHSKRQILSAYFAHWKKGLYFYRSRIEANSPAKFINWDYEVVRDGSFVKEDTARHQPKVSILVRTCQRADVLWETLKSIQNQTYQNVEVIVVEDGEPSSKNMIEKEFPNMNAKYYFTGEKKGRSVAGNLALEKATGEYFNFLDDDDLFYADHIETLVSQLENSSALAAYAFGFETPVIIHSQSPFSYEVKGYNKRYQRCFDEVELCYHNYIPIQCIMFSRRLYEKLGGFDTSLDYLEDWDLWVRYAQKTRFLCVKKTTSLYKVPFNQKTQKERQDKLDQALEIVREKHKEYEIKVSAARLAAYGKIENGRITNVIADSIRNLWKSG